mmetsp:Transcript_4029/g.5926  ORF Transcript_4029/g.5926 Transcript_4029/m.5926 type:complete len:92 (+) Transcript_4029:1052-1327(+)
MSQKQLMYEKAVCSKHRLAEASFLVAIMTEAVTFQAIVGKCQVYRCQGASSPMNVVVVGWDISTSGEHRLVLVHSQRYERVLQGYRRSELG